MAYKMALLPWMVQRSGGSLVKGLDATYQVLESLEKLTEMLSLPQVSLLSALGLQLSSSVTVFPGHL
jgi:hypothetical protein